MQSGEKFEQIDNLDRFSCILSDKNNTIVCLN